MLVMESSRGLGPAAQEADEDVVGEALVEDLGEEVEVGDERGLQDDGPGQEPCRGSRGGKGAHFPRQPGDFFWTPAFKYPCHPSPTRKEISTVKKSGGWGRNSPTAATNFGGSSQKIWKTIILDRFASTFNPQRRGISADYPCRFRGKNQHSAVAWLGMLEV